MDWNIAAIISLKKKQRKSAKTHFTQGLFNDFSDEVPAPQQAGLFISLMNFLWIA